MKQSKSDSNFVPPHQNNVASGFQSLPLLSHFVQSNHGHGVTQDNSHRGNSSQPAPMTSVINSGYWSQENMQEVSLAMKRYMGEAEAKQDIMQQQLDNLKADLVTRNEQVRQAEDMMKNEKDQHIKGTQVLLVQHQETTKILECSILEKEEQLRTMKKHCEKFKGQTATAQQEREELKTHFHLQEAAFVEEKFKLEEQIKFQGLTIDTLKSQTEKLQEKEKLASTVESKLGTEALLRAQELQQKNEVIQDLKSELKALKDDIRYAQETLGNNGKENSQLVDVGRVLKFELTKTKEKLVQRDKDIETLRQERYNLQQELHRINESEENLRRAAENGQEMVVALQHVLEELREKNGHLASLLTEQEAREEQLQRKIEELSKSNTNSAYSESLIEHKINEASSKAESKLKRDVANMNSKMKRNNETNLKYKIEIEALKETIRKLEGDRQKILYEYQNQEQNLREAFKGQLTEVSIACNNEKRNVDILTSKLEQCYVIIEEFEKRTHHLSRKSSECDNHRVNLEVSNTELRVQLEHQTKSMEDLMSDQTVSVERDKERKVLVSQLHKKNKDLQQLNDSLENELNESNAKNERYLSDLEQISERKSQLEAQSKRLNADLLDMNTFMKKTRNEVEELRNVNEEQVIANNKLSRKIETLQDRYSSECSKLSGNIEDSEKLQNNLKNLNEQNGTLASENFIIKRKLQEGVYTMEQLLKENKLNKRKLEEHDGTNSALKRNYEAKMRECERLNNQLSEVTSKVTELNSEILSTKQSVSSSQKEEDALHQDVRTLKHQIEDLARKNNALESQYDEAVRERQREGEKCATLERNLQSVEMSNMELLKEKTTLADYAKKLEFDIGKGLKALQSQDQEIQSMTKVKNDFQMYVTEAKESVITMENQTNRAKQELEEITNKYEASKKSIVTMEKQMAENNECMEEIKMEINTHKMKIEELKCQQANSKSQAEEKEKAYKELLKQLDKLKIENEKLQKQTSSMKARTIEMQAMIDGSKHKQSWITQNDKTLRDEIGKLREQSEAHSLQMIEMKEELMRAQFEGEKLANDLKNRDAELETARKNTGETKEMFQLQKEEANSQIRRLERTMGEISAREKELSVEHETLQQAYKEVSVRFKESKVKCDQLEEEAQRISDEVTKLQAENRTKSEIQSSIEEKNDRLQEHFVKLVDLLRKLKKERDSFAAMLKQSEEESQHLITRYNRIQALMANTSSNLENRKIREIKTNEDNEMLKSRINILKYTESLRSLENKELLEKLAQLEAKLKTDNKAPQKHPSNEDNLKSASTQVQACQLFTDSLQNDTIASLCQRLAANAKDRRRCLSATDTTTLKYRKDIEDFITELSSKTNSGVRTTNNILPTGKPLQQDTRHRRHLNDRKDDALKDSQMERLYEDTKQIQASLLADIKKLSKTFAGKGSFHLRKF